MRRFQSGAIIWMIWALLPAFSSADEHSAASLNPADVQAAVNAARAGDWVVLPAGDNSNWTTTVNIPPGINLRGAGADKTILRQPTGSSARFFCFNSSSLSNSYSLEVYGFKVVGPSGVEGTPVWPTSAGTGIAIEIKKYSQIIIHNLEIHNKNYGIALRDVKKGVIYDCRFYWIINNYSSSTHGTGGYGVCSYTSDPWPADYPAFGSENQVYVEDCHFYGVKHSTSNGATGRMVTRYCKIERGWTSHCSLDAHGQRSGNESSLTTEFYNNEVWLASEGVYESQGVAQGANIRGGQGVIFNNQFHSGGGSSAKDSIKIYDTDIVDAGVYTYPADYPVYWQPRNIWLWGNTYNGSPVDASEGSSWFEENRLTGGLYDYRNVQFPGYAPFPYPHPARLTNQTLAASASASPLSGRPPLTVNFSGRGGGGVPPYSYSWNFGDGESSATQNPSHSYTVVNTYVASLTVRDSEGSQATDSVTLNVTNAADPLVATASASPAAGLPPLTVNFTGRASGGTSPYTYNWSFGDGTSSSVQDSSHTYSVIGSYNATLTVTDVNSARASSSVAITVTSVSSFSLSLSSQTGAPAPGQGGTTNPAPGTHSYAVGASVQLKSLANANYRFSRWSGNISDFSLFNSQTTIMMDANKSLAATFCTKCADVNGDLLITPSDAQAAFDIFLGKLAEPTWCERENADVNLSGSKLAPSVTPSDAQLIFKKYLKKGVTGGDCSGNSRSASAMVESATTPATSLTINQITFQRGQEIAVPIILEASSDITAFGFDLEYPPDALEFVGLERTDLTSGFTQLEANLLNTGDTSAAALFVADPNPGFDLAPPDVLHYGALRVGGYKLTSTTQAISGVLVTIIFRLTGEIGEEIPIAITAVFDDLRNASVSNGAIKTQEKQSDARLRRTLPRRSVSKRYDF